MNAGFPSPECSDFEIKSFDAANQYYCAGSLMGSTDFFSRMQAAGEVLRMIEAAGGRGLLVGGVVRDQVMGLPGGDIDIATDLDLAALARLFPLYDIGKNKDFNIGVARHAGQSFEIARFRGATRHDTEGRPIGMEIAATFDEDAARRDFTMNAMAMDARGEIFDPFGGRGDIAVKVVRCVGDPLARLVEDPLRAMRAVRFAARFAFTIEPATAEAAKEIGPRLTGVAAERIAEELLKMAAQSGPALAKAVQLMADLDLLRYVLPEVEALRELPHDPRHHPEGGVFVHTLAALQANPEPNPTVNLAILLHDAGKAVTQAEKEGRPTYYGHDQAGVGIVNDLGARLKWGRDLTDTIAFAVEQHMRAMRFEEMRPSKINRLLHDPRWPVLRQVARCDLAARGDEAALAALERIFAAAETRAATQPAGPVISGRRVMELTGLPPGPEIGRIIREVSEWAVDHNIGEQGLIEEWITRTATSGKGFIR